MKKRKELTDKELLNLLKNIRKYHKYISILCIFSSLLLIIFLITNIHISFSFHLRFFISIILSIGAVYSMTISWSMWHCSATNIKHKILHNIVIKYKKIYNGYYILFAGFILYLN